jgi:hypothetical protein
MSQHFSVGDFVNPGPVEFPDYQRLGLHRNCRGQVTAVAADGRITVNWNPTGPRTQVGTYEPDQIMPAAS